MENNRKQEEKIEVLSSLLKSNIDQYHDEGKKMFVSSSFQTHSLVLLHLMSKIDPSIPVIFLNTGFHFPETISFKDQIVKDFSLKEKEISSPINKKDQLNNIGHFLFASDPDSCCYLNKVLPMSVLFGEFDVWINGVRRDQSANRSGFNIEEKRKNIIRFHPMLDWDKSLIWYYIKKHQLPRHPMEAKGYYSIGCMPCTSAPNLEIERENRWKGMNKVECGLHTEL